jgi:hypothetical protein
MVQFIGLSTQPVYYNNRRIVGAKVFVYDAGTNTPRTAYADGLAGTEHDWPFLTDANGCIPPFWVTGAAIKVQITTSTGTVIRTVDDIPGETAAASVTPGTGTTISPGFMMAAHMTGTVSGWVRANGRTIGDAASGATERANADTSDLYTVLWNDTLLSVSGGRGASAAADFAANKTIALPDYRGRAFVGLADMGNSTSTRLDGITFATGTKTTLGSTAGAATVTLVEANLASHTHTGTTSTASSHTHSATSSSETPVITVSSDGAHTHTATQDVHSHTVSTGTNQAANGSGKDSVNGASTTSTSTAQPAITVNSASAHTHTATNAAHSHTVTIASDGAHSHTITTGSTGSGTAVDKCQPLILSTIYIKL